MSTLHLMVGLPCSGKTTRARELERELPALRLTVDEWHIPLFGQDADHPEHDTRHSEIEALLWNVASRALALGTDVILDFGFWAREERETTGCAQSDLAQAVKCTSWTCRKANCCAGSERATRGPHKIPSSFGRKR